MADIARGMVSMTPVVTLTADSDANSKNKIHHDIKRRVGGKLEYEKADVCDKWFYDSSKNVTTDANLISGDFTDTGTIATHDHLRYLSVTHTGVDSNGNATSVAVHFTLDGGNPKASVDAFAIGKNESFIIKTANNTNIEHVHAATADDTSVVVEIVALIDDITCLP